MRDEIWKANRSTSFITLVLRCVMLQREVIHVRTSQRREQATLNGRVIDNGDFVTLRSKLASGKGEADSDRNADLGRGDDGAANNQLHMQSPILCEF